MAASPTIGEDRAAHHATHPHRPRFRDAPVPAGAYPRCASPQWKVNFIGPQSGRHKAKLLNFNEEWLRACTGMAPRPPRNGESLQFTPHRGLRIDAVKKGRQEARHLGGIRAGSGAEAGTSCKEYRHVFEIEYRI